jgi:hypothetical protein
MYTTRNFKSKKEFREAVEHGERVTFFQPGPLQGNEPRDGTVYIEGPHFPEPHKWYAQCEAKDGVIVKVVK